jgi:hypothetical protein
MFEPSKLDDTAIHRCLNTISANTFYLMVGSAILKGEELSVVRMADGELALYRYCHEVPLPASMGGAWMERYGLTGISKDELFKRLLKAAMTCTYFAPSVSGIHRRDYDVYDLFPPRDRYVDNFFSYAWTEDYKIQLFKTAKRVLFIHANPNTARAMTTRAQKIGVEVTWLQMSRWEEAEEVAAKGKEIDAPLVLHSSGPASKWIGAEIAHGGNIRKVALDVGSAADRWTLLSLA